MGVLTRPLDVAFDALNTAYVVDRRNHRIQLFGGEDLSLATDIDTLSIGDTLTLRTYAGAPYKLAALFVTGVNGFPPSSPS